MKESTSSEAAVIRSGEAAAIRHHTGVQTILVRAPNWIGDQILAYPFFYFLRKKYPKAHITSVCVPWVADLQFRSCVDEVVVFNQLGSKSALKKFLALRRFSRSICQNVDLAISLPNSFSSAYLLFSARAKVRRGFCDESTFSEARFLFLNDRVSWNKFGDGVHRAQAYLNLIPGGADSLRPASEFWAKLPENELDPIEPGELESFDVNQNWQNWQNRLPDASAVEVLGGLRKPMVDPVGEDQSYFVVAPGATAESRRWPEENFIELIQMLHAETGAKAVLVGGASEAGLCDRIVRKCGPALAIDYAAQTSLVPLFSIFKKADFAVCNESGLAHLAALSGTFVQIICGAASPKRTQPLGPGLVQVAINPVDCWPCEKNHCEQAPGLKIQCLMGIRPEAVATQLLVKLKKCREQKAFLQFNGASST